MRSKPRTSHRGVVLIVPTIIAAVCSTAVAVLIGWALDVAVLKSVIPGLVAMNPATAIGFLLAGLALHLQRHEPVPVPSRRVAPVLAGALLLLGLSVLARYVAGFQWGVDQLLFPQALERAALSGYRNRMAPNTAFMFVLIAVAFLGMDHRNPRVRRFAELSCITTGLLSFLALTGYIYNTRTLYGVRSYIPIALNTALAFAGLAIGILAVRPDRGLAALLRSQSPGGQLLRLLLPASLGLPLVLGLLRLEGERGGLYDTAGGVALSAALTTLILASLVWWSAASLDRADAARRLAERRVREANEDLEARVAERTKELEVEVKERREAESALRDQREFLRKVVDANPQLVFIKDWDGKFLLANRPLAALYGTTVSEIEGKSDADFNPNAAEVEAFRRADRDVMESGRPLFIAEEAVSDRSGETRWFQTVKVPLRGPDGRSRQVLGVATDITERRLAKERLRQTANELQALVQAAPVAIVSIDPSGKVLNWYGGAESLFGWSADEVVGRALANVPPEKQHEFQALRARVERGESIIGLETRRIRKDGSVVDVSISYAPLHDQAGQTTGAIIVYQDITERRLVAEQRQAREAADAANRAKSNFLANMSHELRTPLNAIIGFSELLEDQTFGGLSDRQRRYVANVLSSGRHLLQLVNDILDLAKIEAGRLVLEPEPLDLGILLHDMQRGLEPLAAAKRLSLELDLAQDLPRLTADRAKVKQILYNLLSNAIKFTEQGGRIGLRAAPVQQADGREEIRVQVWDTGIGISPEDQRRIFLEFEQVDSSYVRQQEGTGLGLALTSRLVEAHGGRIEVESAPRQGSTFTVFLPVKVPAGALESPPPSSVRKSEELRERPLILVVEDEAAARELLSHYLLERGFRVAHAATGAEALELARSARPAAITLDIFLPDENGLHLLRRLRADRLTRDIPVVVVSVTDDREVGLNAGAAEWLVKPVQRQQFVEALDRLVPAGSGHGRRLALVVDDDPEAVELATDVLRGRGFEVVQAFGGSEGLAMAIHHSPVLIILDLNMPGVTGFTVAQQLRAHPRTRQTPILVSTAMDLTAAQRDELMHHVQTIVPKRGAEGILEALERLGLTPRAI